MANKTRMRGYSSLSFPVLRRVKHLIEILQRPLTVEDDPGGAVLGGRRPHSLERRHVIDRVRRGEITRGQGAKLLGVRGILQVTLKRLLKRIASIEELRSGWIGGYSRLPVKVMRQISKHAWLSGEGLRRMELFMARLLGQPLSVRSWNKMTFNDKVTYRRLCDHDPRLVTFSDKLATRDYVIKRLGESAVPKLLQVADSADAFADLIGPFVLKANHGSAWNILVDSARTLTPKERSQAQSWLGINYGALYQAWGYQPIEPRLFAEELLSQPPPPDYKLFVFNGRTEAIQVDVDRFSRHRRVLMRPEWSLLGGLVYELCDPPEEPVNLSLMLRWASVLAEDIGFVRVDMYDLGERVVIGELTCYPEAGRGRFHPPDLDRWMGSLWTNPPAVK